MILIGFLFPFSKGPVVFCQLGYCGESFMSCMAVFLMSAAEESFVILIEWVIEICKRGFETS